MRTIFRQKIVQFNLWGGFCLQLRGFKLGWQRIFFCNYRNAEEFKHCRGNARSLMFPALYVHPVHAAGWASLFENDEVCSYQSAHVHHLLGPSEKSLCHVVAQAVDDSRCTVQDSPSITAYKPAP